jgi:hypothetical protein
MMTAWDSVSPSAIVTLGQVDCGGFQAQTFVPFSAETVGLMYGLTNSLNVSFCPEIFVMFAQSMIGSLAEIELELMDTVKFQLPWVAFPPYGEAPGVPSADILSWLGQYM